MKLSKITQFALLGASALALAACSSGGKHSGQPNGRQAYGSASAQRASSQTYAMKPVTRFRVDPNGKRINPMTAPANQSYYFGFDATRMRPMDIRALRIQANYLASHSRAHVRLEGNTDNRGSREYNIGLGYRRDQTVANYLKQEGVSPRQITMISYGKERPVALGNTPRAWALNRRVDLVYTKY